MSDEKATAEELGLEFTFTGREFLALKPGELERLDELMQKPDGGEAARKYYETLQGRLEERLDGSGGS